jgi:hypothetical protein
MVCLHYLFLTLRSPKPHVLPPPYLAHGIVRTASMTRDALGVVLVMFKPMMQKLLNIHKFMIENK